jgi:hypothetical protein
MQLKGTRSSFNHLTISEISTLQPVGCHVVTKYTQVHASAELQIALSSMDPNSLQLQ